MTTKTSKTKTSPPPPPPPPPTPPTPPPSVLTAPPPPPSPPPPVTVDHYKQAEQSLHPDSALLEVLQYVYRDMDLILNDPTLKAGEKMRKYRKLLRKLQFLKSRHAISRAPPPPPRGNDDSLLNSLLLRVPQNKRARTTRLFEKIQATGLVKWNEDGKVVDMAGRRLDPSRDVNIVELLDDASRERKRAQRPEGYEAFRNALHVVDPDLIGNPLYIAAGAKPSAPSHFAADKRASLHARVDDSDDADDEEDDEEEEEDGEDEEEEEDGEDGE